MAMGTQVRLVLADDHKMLREGFKTLLSKQSTIQLVAEAENGAQLLQQVEKYQPDIVITDIKMPVLDGIETCRIITERNPHIGVIALSTYDSENLIIDMLDAGAKGYLLKNTDKKELVKAITTVYEGGTYFCDQVAANFHKMLEQTRTQHYKVKTLVEFTDRELNILKLSCKEYTNKEIAAILTLSSRTVEAHKERMQAKVEAKNIIGVIMYAIKHNLIPVEV
jgi:two-component system, NarL family, response regulator NreC